MSIKNFILKRKEENEEQKENQEMDFSDLSTEEADSIDLSGMGDTDNEENESENKEDSQDNENQSDEGNEKEDKKEENEDDNEEEEKEEEKKEEDIKNEEKKEKEEEEEEDEDEDDDDDSMFGKIKSKEEKKEDDDEGNEDKDKDKDSSNKLEIENKVYNNLSEKFGLKINEDKEINEDTIVEAINEKIENSKKVFEPDVDKYSEDTQNLIKHLEKGGNIYDFIEPFDALNSFKNLDEEKKVKLFLRQNQKMSEEEAEERYETLEDEGKTKDFVDKIDNAINNHKKNQLQSIIKNTQNRRQELEKADTKESKKEREAIKSRIDKTENLFGQEIPKDLRERMKTDLSSGRFHRVIDNPEGAVYAYLMSEYGRNINKFIQKRIKEASREGYNKADKQNKNKRHNKKQRGSGGGGTEESNYQSDKEGTFDAWADDDELQNA